MWAFFLLQSLQIAGVRAFLFLGLKKQLKKMTATSNQKDVCLYHGIRRVHPKVERRRAGGRFLVDNGRFHSAYSNAAMSPD